MIILLYIILIFLVLVIIWHFLTLKYINPYTMDLYIGNKGAGKSCTLAKQIIKSIRYGEKVYTNCEDIKINDVRIFDTYALGKCKVEKAHIFIDEVSLYFDNREVLRKDSNIVSRNFIKFLRECRHLRLKIDLFSQSYDCDKKIRTMCDNIYLGTRYFRVLTVWRRLRKNIAIKEEAMTAESQIVDEINFTPWYLPGSIKITYIPRYIKYFDSFKDLQKYTEPMRYRRVINGYEVRKKRQSHPPISAKKDSLEVSTS